MQRCRIEKYSFYLIAFVIALGFYSSAFADQDYFACPGAVGYAHIGDSVDQIIKTCGNPSSQTVEQVPAPPIRLEKPIVEWIYDYVPNSPFDYGEVITKPKALIIRFQETSTIEIIVEGKSVQSTFYCRPDLEIKIGDSMQTIYQICQWPTKEHTLTEMPSTKTVEQLVLTYKDTITNLSVKLFFGGSKLVSIKSI